MKVVTLLLSGLPHGDPRVTLQYLAQYLDKVFENEDIGTFRLREVNNKIAVDFGSGYDAMLAQKLLDGKSYRINDGELNTLRARINHDPAYKGEQPLPLVTYRPPREPSSSEDDADPLVTANRVIDNKLNYLHLKKKVITTEEQLLLQERMRIRNELMQMDSVKVDVKKKGMAKKSAKKKKRKESSSSSSSSSDSDSDSSDYETSKRKRKRKSSKDSKYRSHKKSHSLEMRAKSNVDKKRLHKKRKSHNRGGSRDRIKRSQSEDSDESSRKMKKPRDRMRRSRDRESAHDRRKESHSPEARTKSNKSRSRDSRERSYVPRQSKHVNREKSHDRSKKSLDRERSRDRIKRDEKSRRRESHDSDESPRERKRPHERMKRSRDRESRDSRDRSYDRGRRSRSLESRRYRSPSYMQPSTSRYEDNSRQRREYRSRSRDDRYRPRDLRESLREKQLAREKEMHITRAIVHRSNKPKTSAEDSLRFESIIVRKKEEKRIDNICPDKIELNAKKKIAIKDILIDMEIQMNDLSVQNNASSEIRKKVLKKMFEIVDKRFKHIKIDNTVSPAHLVEQYRCKFSKIEDERLLNDIFKTVISGSESSLEDVLQGVDVDQLEKNAQIKQENDDDDDDDDDEEGEVPELKIRINVIPTKGRIIEAPEKTTIKIRNQNRPPLNKTPYLYTMYDCGYTVEITINYSRRNIFVIPVKKLIQKYKSEMKKYTDHISLELFEYVLRLKFEKQIQNLLEGVVERLKTLQILERYGTKYQVDKHAFVLEMLCAVWRGEYNDSERVAEIQEENNRKRIIRRRRAKIKQEKDTENISANVTQDTVQVKTEPQNVETDTSQIKTEPENKTNDSVDIDKELEKDGAINVEKINEDMSKVSEENKKEAITDVKAEKNTDDNTATQGDEIVVLEGQEEVIDISDNDEVVVVKPDPELAIVKQEVKPMIDPATLIKMELMDDVIDLSTDEDGLANDTKRSVPLAPTHNVQITVAAATARGRRRVKHTTQNTHTQDTGDTHNEKQDITDSVLISDEDETLESIQEFMNQFTFK